MAELRASDVSELSSEQRAARAALLDEVERYGRRGVFPKNRTALQALAPTFIDEDGTRCAVAHLLESTGRSAFAGQIAHTLNHALVGELAEHEPVGAELSAWATHAGLRLAEVARIQPSYCGITPASCFCGGAQGVSGVIEGVVVARVVEPQLTTTTVRVDFTHGQVGSTAVGSEITLSGYYAAEGDALLIPVTDASGMLGYGAMRVSASGQVSKQCWSTPITLSVDDAVDAFLAGAGRSDQYDSCLGSVEGVDPGYAEDSCADDSGCAAAGPGVDPLVVGSVVAAMALQARRRRSARPCGRPSA